MIERDNVTISEFSWLKYIKNRKDEKTILPREYGRT